MNAVAASLLLLSGVLLDSVADAQTSVTADSHFICVTVSLCVLWRIAVAAHYPSGVSVTSQLLRLNSLEM